LEGRHFPNHKVKGLATFKRFLFLRGNPGRFKPGARFSVVKAVIAVTVGAVGFILKRQTLFYITNHVQRRRSGLIHRNNKINIFLLPISILKWKSIIVNDRRDVLSTLYA
jgi:hypothetical protein